MSAGFNPLNPLSSNPLGGAPPVAVINKPPPKAEEQLIPIKSGFKNLYIQKMCESPEMLEQYDKFDNKKIRLRNKAIEIIEELNQDDINLKKLQ